MLFTIYVNDLEQLIKSNINFFADDTIIYGSDSRLLQSDLETTQTWCNMNLLRIDTSGWGVNSIALFHKVWISCFLRL